jgi:hypothetical protein
MTDPETHATDVACPYCARVFAREDYRDLHLGVDHADDLTDAERERYETALAEEEQALRLFRYKALGLLVLVYFGFLMLYAFSLAGR